MKSICEKWMEVFFLFLGKHKTNMFQIVSFVTQCAGFEGETGQTEETAAAGAVTHQKQTADLS